MKLVRRSLLIWLTVSVLLILSACGNNNSSATPVENSQTAETKDKKEEEIKEEQEETKEEKAEVKKEEETPDKIELEEAVIADNNYFTFTVMQFYYDDKGNSKVELKVTNNSDGRFSMHFYNGKNYLDDEEVTVVDSGGTESPLTGKSAYHELTIYTERAGESKPIESLKDFYRLNGSISVLVFDENNKHIEDLEVSYDFSEFK